MSKEEQGEEEEIQGLEESWFDDEEYSGTAELMQWVELLTPAVAPILERCGISSFVVCDELVSDWVDV